MIHKVLPYLFGRLPNPPNASKYFDGTGNFSTPAGGGSLISTGADGSEPGSPNTGDVYLPNNGVHVERYSGSIWAPWGPIFPMVRPVLANYAWINQGGASVNQTNGGLYFNIPVDATTQYRIFKKAAPTVPYTITAAFLWFGQMVNFHQFGLCFRQSSDGKFQTYNLACIDTVVPNAPLLISQKFTNPTTFSANYSVSSSWKIARAGVIWMRIADDNTNRICSFSPDGQNWTTFHSVGRTDFLTADEVGIVSETENGSFPFGFSCISWKEA